MLWVVSFLGCQKIHMKDVVLTQLESTPMHWLVHLQPSIVYAIHFSQMEKIINK